MFIGEYQHAVDDKGRLAIPIKFRNDLAKGAVVTKGLDDCLFLYSKEEWEKQAEKMAKLPFSIPTDPIEEARIEDMNKRGINPFITYSLPSAIIKFRQGFGRLIRKKNDYGIVTILDSRVLNKFYGKLFIKSLPQCKFISGNIEQLTEAMRIHIDECDN